jgi:beta-lactam-binding protein with PASTA domain
MISTWKRNAMAAALAGALLLVSAGCKKVPDLKGKTRDEADKALQAKKLKLGTVTEDDKATGPAGTVTAQTPEAGAKIPADKLVNITLAPAKTPGPAADTFKTVPRVIGETQESANTMLGKAGLIVGTVTAEVSTNPDGRIFEQNPQENAQVAPGTAVDLKVAANTTVAVPPLVGRSQDYAMKELLAAGLAIGPVTARLDQRPSPAAGTVIETNPDAGLNVARNTPVKLYIKQDATTIPLLRGQTYDAALRAAQDAHLYVVYQCTTGGTPNTIVSQSPDAGTLVARNSDVAVKVAEKMCLRLPWKRVEYDGKQRTLMFEELQRLRPILNR